MNFHPSVSGIVSALAIGFLTLSPNGVMAAETGSHVLVIFTSPENFSDVRDGGFPTTEGRDKILESLRGFIAQRASGYMTAGSDFYINFVDISLAGRLTIGNVYNMRDITRSSSPIFVFGWAVTDRKGAVLKKGAVRLREDNYMNLWSPAREGDPLKFDKAVLDDWMRRNLQS